MIKAKVVIRDKENNVRCERELSQSDTVFDLKMLVNGFFSNPESASIEFVKIDGSLTLPKGRQSPK